MFQLSKRRDGIGWRVQMLCTRPETSPLINIALPLRPFGGGAAKGQGRFRAGQDSACVRSKCLWTKDGPKMVFVHKF